MRSRLLLTIFLSSIQCRACTPKPKPKPLILIPLVPAPHPSDCTSGGAEAIRKCREVYWTKRAKL